MHTGSMHVSRLPAIPPFPPGAGADAYEQHGEDDDSGAQQLEKLTDAGWIAHREG